MEIIGFLPFPKECPSVKGRNWKLKWFPKGLALIKVGKFNPDPKKGGEPSKIKG